MSDLKLQNKVAIVTGAGRGIGRAIALRYAAEGAVVIVDDVDLAGAEGVAAEIEAAGGQAIAFNADVTRSADVRAMVETVLARFGQIDILVNNAGGCAMLVKTRPFAETPEEDWQRVLELNLHGTMVCIQAVLGHMIERRYGKIISLGSIAGVCGLPEWAAYAAAKGAAIALTQTLAMEVGEYGINVNCISPGAIVNEKPGRDWTRGTWLRRGGGPEEVAALAAFLASDEAAYITGANYLIDGGRSIGPLR